MWLTHTNCPFWAKICRSKDPDAEILLDLSDEFEGVVVLEVAVLVITWSGQMNSDRERQSYFVQMKLNCASCFDCCCFATDLTHFA